MVRRTSTQQQILASVTFCFIVMCYYMFLKIPASIKAIEKKAGVEEALPFDNDYDVLPNGDSNEVVNIDDLEGKELEDITVSDPHVINEKPLTPAEINGINERIWQINEEQVIHNQDKFGHMGFRDVIVLIQVHKRVQYLSLLIESLKKAEGIERALVIFSHDYWSVHMNELIKGITEFKYMQIFYPYTMQLYPRRYPGVDPRDCPWNHTKTNNSERSCLNEDWHDAHGNYREPQFSQIKMHWWWKVNRVFDGLSITKNWIGDVLFLEEDQYVTPDALSVLKHMRGLANLRDDILMLSIGNYLRLTDDSAIANQTDFGGALTNVGFAFDTRTWRIIKRYTDIFCNYDDYNWDWSLTNVMMTFEELSSSMLTIRMSRVHHIGGCGVHSKKAAKCSVKDIIPTLNAKINKSKDHFFPKKLQYTSVNPVPPIRINKGNGGFHDYRDVMLCLAISNHVATKKLIKTLQFRNMEMPSIAHKPSQQSVKIPSAMRQMNNRPPVNNF